MSAQDAVEITPTGIAYTTWRQANPGAVPAGRAWHAGWQAAEAEIERLLRVVEDLNGEVDEAERRYNDLLSKIGGTL